MITLITIIGKMEVEETIKKETSTVELKKVETKEEITKETLQPELILVDFYYENPKEKKKIIGRNEDGIICFFHKQLYIHFNKEENQLYVGQDIIRSGETWECELVENHGKCLFIRPNKIIRTVQDNEELLVESLKLLKEKYKK